MTTTDRPRSQAQRDGWRKAQAASIKSRKEAVRRAAETAQRRSTERTPGHHESCRCDSCDRP